jgi:hypothetical protein
MCELQPPSESLTRSFPEGMVANRVEYTPNKIKHHHSTQHRKVDFTTLHITMKKKNTAENIS